MNKYIISRKHYETLQKTMLTNCDIKKCKATIMVLLGVPENLAAEIVNDFFMDRDKFEICERSEK